MAGEGGTSSGSGSSFIRIAGNVKQQFSPFVLNPDSSLLSAYTSSTELKTGASPQIFTYKNYIQEFKSGCAKLNFYPSSMNSIAVNDDVAFKLLYGRMPKEKKSLTINDLLNSIPGIQIREFLPDTRLDQCINMFTDIMKNFASMIDDEKSKSSEGETAKEDKKNGLIKTIGKLAEAFFYTMKYMVGATDPDFFDDIGNFKNLPFSSYNEDVYKTNGKSPAPGYSVMAFPYVLYYKLQSCCTTNIYEIPAVDSGKRIIQATGKAGWTSGGDILSEGGFRVSKLLSKIPLIGDLANMALGNIGINYMPWWNAEAGSKTQEPAVEITFDLFNDSAEAALKNFIFVNTIVPNNRWIQYNMFQHSSNLYDVKIEGVNRLFACAGDFDVTYEGILRDPPEAWLKTLANKHLNKNLNEQRFLANAKNYKLIKIPDVYRVKLSFQSLLPANFNNFIYTYAQNINHITEYSDKVYQQSAVSEILPNAVGRYVKRIVAFWNADKDNEKAANNAVSDVKSGQDYEL